jgi:hypothetical protein
MYAININSNDYQNKMPYPHMYQDDFLDKEFAEKIQKEILEIPDEAWDRYENPFESKFTLRDKFAFPENLNILFEELQSKDFVTQLSKVVGYKLFLDPTRNFWGVHKYNNGDKLDIHVDAGLHPTTKQKKQVTLGIYLSENWKEEYGCQLEIWRGENAVANDAKIYEKIVSISPLFNRMILFTCNDYAWHGNPEPAQCPEDSKRIFITISYLSENYEDLNKRQKAYFVARPNDPKDEEKDKLRLLRADAERFKSVYRT